MVVVVDYGMGNLRSIAKALEFCGAKVKVSNSPKDCDKADRLVLPGVGAFGDAMAEIKRAGLSEALCSFIQSKKKFLGVCLGLQLLFSESEENPGVRGLDVFPGKVKRFQSTDIKIPHMGWNDIKIENRHPVLQGIDEGSFFYFVHSYYGVPSDPRLIVASCGYGNERFAACLGTDSVFATQFHPEKSQQAGLLLLKNFLAWS